MFTSVKQGFSNGAKSLRNRAAQGSNYLKSKMPTLAGPKQEDPNYGLGNITDEQRAEVKDIIKGIREQLDTIMFQQTPTGVDELKRTKAFSDQYIVEGSASLLKDITRIEANTATKQHYFAIALQAYKEALKKLAEIKDAGEKQAPPPVTGGSKKVSRKTRKIRRH